MHDPAAQAALDEAASIAERLGAPPGSNLMRYVDDLRASLATDT